MEQYLYMYIFFLYIFMLIFAFYFFLKILNIYCMVYENINIFFNIFK